MTDKDIETRMLALGLGIVDETRPRLSLEERIQQLNRLSDLTATIALITEMRGMRLDDLLLDRHFNNICIKTGLTKKMLRAKYDNAEADFETKRSADVDGKFKLAKVYHLLDEDPRYAGKFKYNEFTREIEVHNKGTVDRLSDEIVSMLTINMQRSGYMVATSTVREALQVIVKEDRNRYNPITDYLLECYANYDKIPRLDRAAMTYWGAKTELENVFIKKHLIGMVARAMTPGCKMDTMLVLEGPQGIYKSSSIAALMPSPDFFLDKHLDLSSKDTFITLKNIWAVEMSELAAFKGRDAAAIKAWLSSTVDRFRPPYGHADVDFPRQYSVWASVNEQVYLDDYTGNRRTWPVTCGKIELDRIRIDRTHLWGEAVTRWKAGVDWWLDKSEESGQEAAVDARTDKSVIEEKIEKWVGCKDEYIEGGGGRLEELRGWMKNQYGESVYGQWEFDGRKSKFTKGELFEGIGLDWQNKRMDSEVSKLLQKLGYMSITTRRMGFQSKFYVLRSSNTP